MASHLREVFFISSSKEYTLMLTNVGEKTRTGSLQEKKKKGMVIKLKND
jgi:hypothetical protein